MAHNTMPSNWGLVIPPLAKPAAAQAPTWCTRIVIAHHFTPWPAIDGPSTGPRGPETFREQLLAPALRETAARRKGGCVETDLEGLAWLPVEWIEEAFGGLVSDSRFNRWWLEHHLVIEGGKAEWRKQAWRAIERARMLPQLREHDPRRPLGTNLWEREVLDWCGLPAQVHAWRDPVYERMARDQDHAERKKKR